MMKMVRDHQAQPSRGADGGDGEHQSSHYQRFESRQLDFFFMKWEKAMKQFPWNIENEYYVFLFSIEQYL